MSLNKTEDPLVPYTRKCCIKVLKIKEFPSFAEVRKEIKETAMTHQRTIEEV